MKKTYTVPELKIVRFTLNDVILNSPTESSISGNIGGDDNNPIDLDDENLGD